MWIKWYLLQGPLLEAVQPPRQGLRSRVPVLPVRVGLGQHHLFLCGGAAGEESADHKQVLSKLQGTSEMTGTAWFSFGVFVASKQLEADGR